MSKSDERVSYISNFKGSNAICLVSQTDAYLWTDGRYYLQAINELYPDWKMMKMDKNSKNINEILLEKIIKVKETKNINIGIDKSLINSGKYFFIKKKNIQISFVK